MERQINNRFLALVLLGTFLQAGAETLEEADWPLCPQALNIPARPEIDVPLEAGEIHVSADKADLEQGGISVLQGNVEITRDQQQVSADYITYDEVGSNADLEGDVEYWDDAVYVQGDRGRVEFETETGSFENSSYIIKDNRARGKAGRLWHEYGLKSELENVDYTTCDPEDNFWKFSAREIHLDHVEERGTAKHVVLKIKDVPVFYSPYVSFPLSKKRKTGFLIPGFGNSNRNGLEILTPFYWNIAPEMDATLTPRVLTDSGVMLVGQFRYLLDRGYGEFNGEYLPSDSEFNNDDRSFLSFMHQQQFADAGNLFLTYNRVSDKSYFEDFGANIGLTSIQYLERRAEASYHGSWWNAFGRIQDYQTVDNTIPLTSRPYKRLPQFHFDAYSPFRNRALNFNLSSDISYFDRGDNDIILSDINGARLDLFPSVSYPIHTLSSYLIPKIGLRFTQYSLSDEGTFKPSPSRILPTFSVDSGLYLERDATLFNTEYLQTLEPRLFYLYVPHDDQSDLPVFDTGLYDFSYDSMFYEDRFSGPDRMGDANRFTLALTSRFINHNTGRELGYLGVGQIYHLRDREVTLPGSQQRDEDSSPIIAGAGINISNYWRMRGDIQWDPNNDRTEKLAGFIQYNPEPNKIINLGYRERKTTDSLSSTSSLVTDIEQTEVSFAWPITQNWSTVGRWVYALSEEKTVDAFGGVEYDSCCWGFRIVARRFVTDSTGDSNFGVFLQLELKGLAGIGEKTVEFLEENIRGYQRGF